MTPAEVLRALPELPPLTKRYLVQEMNGARHAIQPDEERWLSCYMIHVGWDAKQDIAMLARPHVKSELERRLEKVAEMSGLTAEYVRNYIMSVMEHCPTDFFSAAPDGGWLIDPANWAAVPRDVKRLVERVELKYIRGNQYLAIEFVSKTAALALAARYALAHQPPQSTPPLPWKDISASLAARAQDSVEKRLEVALTDARQRAQGPI